MTCENPNCHHEFIARDHATIERDRLLRDLTIRTACPRCGLTYFGFVQFWVAEINPRMHSAQLKPMVKADGRAEAPAQKTTEAA
jgi:hypothetical protein